LRRPEIETHTALRPDFGVILLALRRIEIRRIEQHARTRSIIHIGMKLCPAPAVKTVRGRARRVETFECKRIEFYSLAGQVVKIQAVFVVVEHETPPGRLH
jgi:hypothetical protein